VDIYDADRDELATISDFGRSRVVSFPKPLLLWLLLRALRANAVDDTAIV
jgi:hypothetical protein